jgi:hypothetical protein
MARRRNGLARGKRSLREANRLAVLDSGDLALMMFGTLAQE